MQQVQFVTAGFDHCIVVKKDGKHFGWGNTASFIKDGKEFVSRPVQVTEYGVWKDGVVVKAGYKCTVIVDNLGEGKNVKIVDNIGKFKEKEHQFDK